jgi:type VI secretion system protein ImpA
MINVDDLLKPIADGKPAGEDFAYHPSFQKMEELARGKPETQFGPGEEPEWKEVRDAAMEVLQQSKHLSAGVTLTIALLKLGGVEGLRDGVAVVRGLTEKYWADLYPSLDPEDNNDPTQRLNILGNLSSGKFVTYLKQIVLCNSTGMGRITLEQVQTAKAQGDKGAPAGGTGGAASGPDLNQIQAAFLDAGPAAAAATLAFINESIGHAQGIEKFLDSTLGAGRGVSFESLNKLLAEMKQVVAPHATGGAPVGDAPGEAADSGPADSGGSVSAPRLQSGISGSVQTRAHVVKALDLVCAYYRTNEPSSPVPLILQRAQRLVEMDFMAIMTDLNPDALSRLEVITGTKSEK